MRFQDIEQFIGIGTYEVDVMLPYLNDMLKGYEKHYTVTLNPDFQRGHVWTKEQQIKYIEFFLQGGKSARTIYFNCPAFGGVTGIDIDTNELVCVDGLQRMLALLSFTNDSLKVFGHYYSEYEDKPRDSTMKIKFNINCLRTKKEVLKWYLQLNTGGTPHSESEINRVQQMLNKLD